MKEDQDYIRDITAMRSMMERSTKFFSLSGLAGIMAGIYALAGTFIAWKVFNFDPNKPIGNPMLLKLIALAAVVLVLAIGTAIFLSLKKANKRREKFWNATSKRFVINMAVPLVAGGLFVLILVSKDLVELALASTLVFYGLALYTASKFTYEEVRSMGLIQVALGLAGAYFNEYGLWFWALGFGAVNIIYGIYLYYRYER